MHNLAKDNVKNLLRFKDIGSNREAFIRLDKNERTIPFAKENFKEIISRISSEDLVRYPDQSGLYEKIADSLSVSPKNLLLTPGSDAGIKYIFETFVNKNDYVGFLSPTYAMFEVYSNLFEARIKKFIFNNSLEIDLEDLFYSLENIEFKIIFIANPNQPTGTSLSDKIIDKIIRICKKKNILLVIDQAYHDFSNLRPREKEACSNQNLILVRTLSKGYGLAGVRLGFIVAHEEVTDVVYRVKPLADINILAIKASEYILENENIHKKYVNDVKRSKKIVKDFCLSNDLIYLGSDSNFVHIRGIPCLDTLKDELKKNNYLLRFNGDGLPANIENSIRISLGPPKQTKEFLKCLEVPLNGLKAQ